MTYWFGSPQRRAMRRAARSRCQVVSRAEFELLGETALDVSPRGILLACDVPVALGERVIMSLSAPGPDEFWLDAEAEVARIVYGFRNGDPGYCAGLRFTYLERSARQELLTRLVGLPPPVPQRRPGSRGRNGGDAVRMLFTQRIGKPYPVPAGVFCA
ncbi:MAG TPA: PilZ domain-containing protein [Polyangiales bacterium]|nr:PilZ domain-containing protein [Polyangiales bacterium]